MSEENRIQFAKKVGALLLKHNINTKVIIHRQCVWPLHIDEVPE